MEYHFDVPNMMILISHVLIGIFLFGLLLSYVEYIGVLKQKISKHFSIILLILGVLGGLYHSHIWYIHIK